MMNRDSFRCAVAFCLGLTNCLPHSALLLIVVASSDYEALTPSAHHRVRVRNPEELDSDVSNDMSMRLKRPRISHSVSDQVQGLATAKPDLTRLENHAPMSTSFVCRSSSFPLPLKFQAPDQYEVLLRQRASSKGASSTSSLKRSCTRVLLADR
jgi:hypothetical protein